MRTTPIRTCIDGSDWVQALAHASERLAALQGQCEAEAEAGARAQSAQQEMARQLAEAQRLLQEVQPRGPAGVQSTGQGNIAHEKQVRDSGKRWAPKNCCLPAFFFFKSLELFAPVRNLRLVFRAQRWRFMSTLSKARWFRAP